MPGKGCRGRRAAAGALAALLSALAGCEGEGVLDARYDPETPFEEGAIGTWRAGLTVGEAGGCSTGIVAGLARQLIDEINCLRPDTLVDFRANGVRVTDVVWPYLQAPARGALHAAVRARGGSIPITSALRTLPQQYLLYRWWQQGRCGIQLAARPGRSRHESGLAIDTSDPGGWRGALEARGWRWLGNSDRVHFDYVGDGTVNLAGLSVLAFQRLWNRNHPNDRIAEDGEYGPQTEARLRRAPTGGFPRGACEPEPPPPPPPQDTAFEIVARWLTIEGQDRDLVARGSSAGIFDAVAGQPFRAAIRLRNGADRPVARELTVGYALSEPYLRATAYVVERQVGERWEPIGDPVPEPPPSGRVVVGDTPPGEVRRVRFDLVAERPSFGFVGHATLHAWVIHVADFYGEQDGWDDEVEHNGAGRLLRHVAEVDVFSRDDWRFRGPHPEDTEGWRACGTGATVRVDPGFHALVAEAGCAESPPWTAIDTSTAAGLRFLLRGEATAARIAWRAAGADFLHGLDVALRGDGEPEELLLDLRDAPGWSGEVAGLRLEANGPVALQRATAVGPDTFAPSPGLDAGPPPDAGPPDAAADVGPPDADCPPATCGRDADAAAPDLGLAGDPTRRGRRVLAARFEGGCTTVGPSFAAPWALLALLALRPRRERRRHER